MFWIYDYDYVSSELHNDILPAHQPQNCWAQKSFVESVSAAFAQLYRIKLLPVKKETTLTDECDRQLKHASQTLQFLTDSDLSSIIEVKLLTAITNYASFLTFFSIFVSCRCRTPD